MSKYSPLFHGAVRSQGNVACEGLNTVPQTGNAREIQAAAVKTVEREGTTSWPQPAKGSLLLLPVPQEKTSKLFPELTSLSKVGKATSVCEDECFKAKRGRTNSFVNVKTLLSLEHAS